MTQAPLADLRTRRAGLPAAAARYFEVLQTDAVVLGTDAAERFIVQGDGPGRARLQVWACRPARPDSLLGEQRYTVRHTRRLRVYGLGGNDQFELRGHLAPGFAVWLDGGAGANRFAGPAPRTQAPSSLTVYAAAPDQLQLSPAVRVRQAAPAAGSGNASSWVGIYYRLGLGSK